MRNVAKRYGGLVDPHSSLNFTFNGRSMGGHQGDTLASALLANGQKIVGRSFKYHRPRGIFSTGSEEPNALVQLRGGAYVEPNTRATIVELFNGLEATSQNHRGSLKFDLMAINDLLSPFLTAGFYYKTFMWPKAFWEKLYEPLIRASAGLGKLSMYPDPDCYDKGFLHCDLLVVGAGPAGLAAALAAGRSGVRTIIADEDFLLGGRLNFERMSVNRLHGHRWAADTVSELEQLDNVRIMKRTTIFGAFDHGIFGALERTTDHLVDAGGKPRQVLWRIYAKHSMICTGAIERGIAFPGNDRPNIMLAGAARGYLNRFGVVPGNPVTVFCNNDFGWRTAHDFEAAGLEVFCVIDTRTNSSVVAPGGVQVEYNGRIRSTSGRQAIKSIRLTNGITVSTGCLAVSGGWNPNVHLTCHKGNRPVWNRNIAAFVPGPGLDKGMVVAGAANGTFDLGGCLREGFVGGEAIAADLGLKTFSDSAPSAESESVEVSAFWYVSGVRGRAWLDLQNDVTTKDVEQACREGFSSVEHLKRYTTLGMATDQGKTSNALALGVMASITNSTMESTGTTVFRPPYNPVTIGAFAGRARGKSFKPVRQTPSHEWSKRNGAVFVEVGNWLRPQYYVQNGETHWRQSVDREVLGTRSSVGVCDVSTLGKIDIKGNDCKAFLNHIYANGFTTLAVNRVRYGLMLREDGIVYDDGTTARLGENHYVMTTTTANAALVFRQLEFARQCLWPELDVHLVSVTDAWAQYSISGPNSRALLVKLLDDSLDISNQTFPFMECRNVDICGGIEALLFRISFSGELAYEIAVPARFGNSMMEALIEAGREYDVVPYGTEALGVMRIEKGHVAGNEINGQTTAHNLGLARMLSRKKDFIGSVLSQRSAMIANDGLRLVGFKPVGLGETINAGAHLFDKESELSLEKSVGWISSAAYSPTFGHSIALGFLKCGDSRIGNKVIAADPVRNKSTQVQIVSPHFYDPDGERQRG